MSPRVRALLIIAATVLVLVVTWLATPVWRVLAIVAAALLFWRLGSGERAPMREDETGGDAQSLHRDEIATLMHGLAAEGRNQCETSIAELERVKDLLRHAIDQLVASFDRDASVFVG